MTARLYAIQMTDRSPGAPGESEELSLLVLYAGKPIGAVTIEWHGEFELALTSSKFFGGKSPGIDNAWQLANLVCRAVETEHRGGITGAVDGFSSEAGDEVIWEFSLEPPDRVDPETGSATRQGRP